MNLEDFINENRKDFDNKKLPDNRRVDFEKELRQELHAKSKVFKLNSNVFKVAASIVLLLGAYTLGRFYNNINSSNDGVEITSTNNKAEEMLALTLMVKESPHRRIEGINYLEDLPNPDEVILKALIDRLLFDQNTNVRFSALRGLENHIAMDLVKEALIKALEREKDSKIQVSIIHLLISINEKRAVKPIQKFLENENIEPMVKEHIASILPQLI